MSLSNTIHQRLAKRSVWRKICAWTYILSGLIYLTWRLSIFSSTDFGTSLVFYLTEVFGFILALVSILLGWKYTHRPVLPCPDGEKVDVFVPVYKEPLEMIRMTILGARAIRYPHRTVLLDDGGRDELKELAQELNVDYLCREGNRGAKAGNLNYGLEHSDADYIVVFDADHIAQVQAIEILLGQFEHDNIAFVQAPQDFYNSDSIQYLSPKKGKSLCHDQTHFYHVSLSCRETYNAATSVGTGVMYRVAAIDSIGGFPEETVTEDLHVALKFHKAGYDSRFINEPVAYGVAAADVYDYYRTRHRWAHGNLHALSEEKLLTCRGLTLKQRLSYLCFGLIALEGWQQLGLILIPILSLLFGLQPFEITVFNVILVLVFPLATIILTQEQGNGLNRYWANEILAISRIPVHLCCLGGLMRRKIKWAVSLKNLAGTFSWRLIFPQLLIIVCSFAAIVAGVYHWVGGAGHGPLSQYLGWWFSSVSASLFGTAEVGLAPPEPLPATTGSGAHFSLDLIIVSGFWASYNLVRGCYWLFIIRRLTFNTYEFTRFALRLPVYHRGRYVGVTDWVSKAEIGFSNAGDLSGQSVTLLLPGGPVELDLDDSNTEVLPIIFELQASRDKWNSILFSLDWQRETEDRTPYFPTLVDHVMRIVTLGKLYQEVQPEWATMLDVTGQNAGLCYLGKYRNKQAISLLIFRDCKVGDELLLCNPGNDSKRHYVLVDEEECNSVCTIALDGTQHYRYQLKLKSNEGGLGM